MNWRINIYMWWPSSIINEREVRQLF